VHQYAVADERLSAYIGTDEDYTHFRMVSGRATIERAVAELNARLAERRAAPEWLSIATLSAGCVSIALKGRLHCNSCSFTYRSEYRSCRLPTSEEVVVKALLSRNTLVTLHTPHSRSVR
jgi:hypothetical protein